MRKNEMNMVFLIVFSMELDKLILKMRSNFKRSTIALKILNREKEAFTSSTEMVDEFPLGLLWWLSSKDSTCPYRRPRF